MAVLRCGMAAQLASGNAAEFGVSGSRGSSAEWLVKVAPPKDAVIPNPSDAVIPNAR